MDGRYVHGHNPMSARMAGAQQGWPPGSSRYVPSMASVPGRHVTDRVPPRMADSRMSASRMVPALMNSNHMPCMYGGEYSRHEHHEPMPDPGDDADMQDSYLSGSAHKSHGSRDGPSCSEDEKGKKHKQKRTRRIISIATRRVARLLTINTNTGGRTTEVDKHLANAKAMPARKES